MASATYTAIVSKPELGADATPDDPMARPHHVKKKNGTTASFTNIHPSSGGMFETWALSKSLFQAKMNGKLNYPDTSSHTIHVVKPTFPRSLQPRTRKTDRRPTASQTTPNPTTRSVNPQFKQIGDLRGPFDLGLIPVGAYKPRQVMSAMHCNPLDSVELFRDRRCRRAMGMHWGTLALTSEDVMEPPVLLRKALRRRGMKEDGLFDVCAVGEGRKF